MYARHFENKMLEEYFVF